jgi:hypothetical protein
MISFLHPGFLYAAFGVALGIIALHFIVTEQPRTGVLPTVRFFPDVKARATTLAIRLSDLALLAVRVLTVLLVGAAFAQPRLNPSRSTVARVVALDLSRNTRSLSEVANIAHDDLRSAAAVILFDSTAREIPAQGALDSLSVGTSGTGGRREAGRLSPALIASLRAAARVRERADSVEIVIVSPLLTEERDAGTLAIRSLWPGHIRVIRVNGSADSLSRAARESSTIEWADSVASGIWAARLHPDTIGAVSAGTTVLVYPFVRRWTLAAPLSGDDRVVARWMDGEPAVIERSVDGGCIRSVSIAFPILGDAILRPEFVRFREMLSGSCGGSRDMAPLPAEFVSALEGRAGLAPVSAIEPRVTRMTPPVPWLLAAALAMALLELVVRRRRRISEHDAGQKNSRTIQKDESVGRVA